MKIEDDTGKVHPININGTYYMAGMSNQILSQQHFAHVANDHHPKPEGTGLITNSKNITLFWGQKRYTKTIPLDKNLSIGLTRMAPGSEAFTAYLATMPNDRVDVLGKSLIPTTMPQCNPRIQSKYGISIKRDHPWT